MAMTCKEVWREISEYIDNSISPKLRKELERHLAQCRHCAALVDSVHNVLILVADERVFAVPTGFRERLHARLKKDI